MTIFALALLLAACQSRPSADRRALLGADEVIRRLATVQPQPVRSDPFVRVKAKSTALSAQLASLSPTQAADAWVALMLEWESIVSKMQPSNPNSADQWAEVMMTPLPEPKAWPLIRDRLAKLRPSAKRRSEIALFDDLLGKDDEVLRYLEGKRNPDADPLKEDVFSSDHEISEAEQPIAERVGDLDLLEKIYVRRLCGNTLSPWDPAPDIVKLFGKPKATRIIGQLLEADKAPLGGFKGVETQDLARSMVLAGLPKLKSPQWSLVRGLKDFAFVEKLVARFGEDALVNSGSTGGADLIYALGLAERGQIDRSINVLSSIAGGSSDLPTFAANRTEEESLFALVSSLLDRKPLEALWPLYEALGRSLGRMDEVRSRLAIWLARPGLTDAQERTYLDLKADLDLAFGQTKTAIAELREAVKLKSTNLVEKLLDVADVSGDRESVDFVAATAKSMGTSGSRLSLFDAYLGQTRISDAQRAALMAAQDVHNVNLSAEGQGRLLNANPGIGVQLAELYYLENQPNEVLTVLREYPHWGVDDLSGVIDQTDRTNYGWRRGSQTLGFYAAWAFAKTGQKPLAVKILHSLFAKGHRGDATLGLLNDVEGAGAIQVYDEMIKASPFAFRLLAWRADALLRAGRIDEAERCIRAAIALDPVDEDAAYGFRRVAYDVLGRVLKAKGKEAEAEACSRIVRAARMDEHGGDAERVRMYTTAVEAYDKALEFDPNDVLAATRLRDSLEELGRPAEADAAFERALSLLPGTQGPTGGPDIFASDRFRSEEQRRLIRSKLSALRQAHPQDVGLLFASGQFESAIGNRSQALAIYEEVVKIDPRYVRAWEEIVDLARGDAVAKNRIQEAVIALIGLDASRLNNYSTRGAEEVFSDKSALWLAYRKAMLSKLKPSNESLFPLEASRRSLASGTRPLNAGGGPFNLGGVPQPRPDTPGAALARLAELQHLFP